MQIRVQFFVHNANAGKHFIYLWIPIKSPSRDMSSTPRKITYSAQMSDLKKQHAKSVFLSQLNRSKAIVASKLEIYRYFNITYDTFWVGFIAECIFRSLESSSVCSVPESSPFWREFTFELCLFNPQQTFRNPSWVVFSKSDIFCLSMAKICKPHRTVGWWYK